MRLSHLRLSGYRNLRDQDLELPTEGIAILGRNAQGKTNLLEAIHYLEAFRSFRGTRDDQIVRFGGDVFRVEARVDGGGASPSGPAASGTPVFASAPTRNAHAEQVIAAAYEASTRRKRITVDGQVVTRIGDAIGRLGVVLFTPDDVRLVTDGPSERRRFLDILLSLNDPDYLVALQRYRQALLRRNAVLRKRGTSSAVAAWDEILVESGSRVLSGRMHWIARWNELFTEYCAEVSGGGGARMVHIAGVRGLPSTGSVADVPPRPGAGGAGEGGMARMRQTIGRGRPSPVEEEVASAFERALLSASNEERLRGTTLAGPHRDDVHFRMFTAEGETDAREFGSGGQRRTVALALRLVEAATVRHERGHEPLLLLDDVFAELDEGRSHRVLRLLDRVVPGQVILTAPKESDVRFRGEVLRRRYMRDGEVTE